MSETGLRDRLVGVGVELVAREGVGALSLREIARRAGVSHGAPRRYFPTHQSLLAAIAAEGYQELGVLIRTATAGGGPREQVCALARAYLDFAAAHRGMFELMFRHELLRGNGVGLREEARPLFGVLVGLLRKLRPHGTDVELAAGALWANLHGLAQLRLWGSLEVVLGTDRVDELLEAALSAHLGREV